jgi:hypothetical protein
MDATKNERFEEFLKRLEAAPPAASAAEAMALLSSTLNAVEDEMTSIPYNPALPTDDGRMYPPQEDNAHTEGEFPGVVRYRNARHNTRIDRDGGIRIDEVRGRCVLTESGRLGQEVVLFSKA